MKKILLFLLACLAQDAPDTDQEEQQSLETQVENYFWPRETNTEVQVETCENSDECSQAPFYICNEDFVCQHKSVFPITPIEFIGLCVLPIMVGFANVAGIGGGGLTIPLLLLFWGFNTKESISLSCSIQFVGSLVRYFYSVNTKHPEKNSTHIDYGIVIVMLPLVILGSFIGVLVNIIFPPLYLSVMLVLLLALLSLQASFQAIKLFVRESQQIRAGELVQFTDDKRIRCLPDIRYVETNKTSEMDQVSKHNHSDFELSVVQNSHHKLPNPLEYMTSDKLTRNPSPRSAKSHLTLLEIYSCEQLLQQEQSHIKQWSKHLLAVLAITLSLIVNYLRGNRSHSNIQKCSTQDWIICGVFGFLMLMLTVLGLYINRSEQALKIKVGKGLVPSDIRYTGKQLLVLPLFAFLGGLISGTLGIGGSSVFNPIMIGLGVPPIVATSTGMYMVLYSTGASTVMYLNYGTMNLQFMVWLSFWSSIGIVVGINMVNSIMQKYNRQSILVAMLAVILVVSAVLVTMDVASQFQNQPNLLDEQLWSLNSFCE